MTSNTVNTSSKENKIWMQITIIKRMTIMNSMVIAISIEEFPKGERKSSIKMTM